MSEHWVLLALLSRPLAYGARSSSVIGAERTTSDRQYLLHQRTAIQCGNGKGPFIIADFVLATHLRKQNVGQEHPFCTIGFTLWSTGKRRKAWITKWPSDADNWPYSGENDGRDGRRPPSLMLVVPADAIEDIFIRRAGKELAVHVNDEKDIAKEQPIVENSLGSKGVDNAYNDLVSAPTSKTTAPE
ncbi:hypothetical protein M404DRAFT_947601 [Pisolithus tinctorius Marx 270]|uniref:Secreted protein n=1 Tax=Pisolithus tinctorius Marx 270 TaxID=870435 RepID=A0A0C3PDH5_PISTI|nr:hypothetical protein M404DRAFT_947601 [Pisolithus tinctorius Marx 270]